MIHEEIDDRKDIKNNRKKINMTEFLNLENHKNGDNPPEINPSLIYSKNFIH